MERKKGTTVTANMDTMEVTEAMEIVAMDTDIMEITIMVLRLTALRLTAPHMMALRCGTTRNCFVERKKGTTVTTNMDTMEVTEAMEIVAMDTGIMEITIMAIAEMVGVKRALDLHPTH